MIEKVIVLLMCMLVIFSVIVFFTGIIIDLTNKITFDLICYQALKKADLHGGLPIEYQDDLKLKLNDNKFYDVSIKISEKVQYKDYIKLEVTSSKSTITGLDIFKFEKGSRKFVFKKEIVSRKIHNLA